MVKCDPQFLTEKPGGGVGLLQQRGHDDALAVALRLRLGPHVHLPVQRGEGGGRGRQGRVDPRRVVLGLEGGLERVPLQFSRRLSFDL